MAGHTLVFIISSFISNILSSAKYGFVFIGFFVLLMVLTLELGVAFLQHCKISKLCRIGGVPIL